MQLSDVVRIALIFSEDAKRYAKGLAGSIDLSGKADKKKPSKAGNLAALDASGNLTDSGKAGANVAVKAKPSKAGNLAALTADGSLSDSGIDPATKADLQDGKTKSVQMAKSFTFDKTTVKFNYSAWVHHLWQTKFLSTTSLTPTLAIRAFSSA